MNNVYRKLMPPSVYEKNETMQLLGKQCMMTPFWCNGKVRKGIDEIAEARPYSFTIDATADIFTLGYIEGKRAERAKRKNRIKDM